MKIMKSTISKAIITFAFSVQIIVSGIVYYIPMAGVVINSVFLCMFFVLNISMGGKSSISSKLLYLLPLSIFFSTFVNANSFFDFSISPVMKTLFIMLSFSIGLKGGFHYGWRIVHFQYIGVILVLSGVCSLYIGYVNNITTYDPSYAGALVGVSIHPAVTAFIFSTAFPFLILVNKSSSRFLALLSYIAIFVTMRRTALIGCFPFLLMLFYSKPKGSLNLSTIVLIIAVVLILLSNSVVNETIEVYSSRLFSLFSGSDSSGSGRSVFWGLLIAKVMESSFFEILFGRGANAIYDFLFLRYGVAIGAHNDFIDLLFSFGIFPMLILMAFYTKVLFTLVTNLSLLKSRTKRRKEILCAISTICYLIFNSFVSGGSLEAQAAALYFVLGLSLSQLTSEKRGIKCG